MPVKAEAQNNQHTHDAKRDTDQSAELAGGALGARGGGESPFAQEIPDPDAEMERRSKNAGQKKCQIPGICEVARNGSVGGFAVGHPALGIQVPADVSKSDKPGVTLQREQPVLNPWILRDIALAVQ